MAEEKGYVVKIFGAGKSGLEAIPHFLDEFCSLDIPLLRPTAFEWDLDTQRMFNAAIKDPARQALLKEHHY